MQASSKVLSRCFGGDCISHCSNQEFDVSDPIDLTNTIETFFSGEEWFPRLSSLAPTRFLREESRGVEFHPLILPNNTPGKPLADANPVLPQHLFQLGEKCAILTNAMSVFEGYSCSSMTWQEAKPKISQAPSCYNDFSRFRTCFRSELYLSLPEQLVHVDWLPQHVLLDLDPEEPIVLGFTHLEYVTQAKTIHALAHACAVSMIDKKDPLDACFPIIQAFHRYSPRSDEELQCLFTCISFHLCLLQEHLEMSCTRRIWNRLNEKHVYYAFRHACGMPAHPQTQTCLDWLETHPVSLQTMIPSLKNPKHCAYVDLSISSTWLGHISFQDKELFSFHLARRSKQCHGACVAGGHLEVRPYADVHFHEGNQGPEFHNVHIGSDFWLSSHTEICCPLDGTIVNVYQHRSEPSSIITVRHEPQDGLVFFTEYDHISPCLVKEGDMVSQGDPLGSIAASMQGVTHLHMQIMLDEHAPCLVTANQVSLWSQVCFDPHLWFDHDWLGGPTSHAMPTDRILAYRKAHLGSDLTCMFEKPLHIVRGEGAFLMDINGRKYLDTMNNVAHVGHEHPRIVEVGQSQMAILNTNTLYLHENITKLADALLAKVPDRLKVIHFVNSGTEANELALRMAKAYTGGKDVIALEGGYHGNSNAMVDISSYKFDGEGGQGSPEHTHIVPCPDTYRGLYRGKDAASQYANHVQDALDAMKCKERQVAAFIAEPIGSCMGQIEPPAGYFAQVYDMVHRAGGVCIADEVQAGFGRCGDTFWSFELHEGCHPDIVTMGKMIGNGHPLAAVICTKEIADKFANGMDYFNTYGGNPVSCAIGLEVLRVLEDEQLQAHAKEVGAFLLDGLRTLQAKHPIMGDVRGRGFFLGVELVDGQQNPLPNHGQHLLNRMKQYGIIMLLDGIDHNVLKIKPPMAFSKENATQLLEKLDLVLSEDFFRF